MSEISFERLHQFFCKVPSVQEARIMAHGADGEHAWWFKFSIDVEHALAWQTVQELGHVLNYLSTNERLPTLFFPVSPPPYMNGEAKDFLSWIIQCNHPEFSPDVVCDWLEARLPNPVDDESQWKIKTDLSEIEKLDDKALDQKDFQKILNTLHSVHNGVFRMSPAIKDLVEASSSLARVIIKDGEFITQSLQRSSVESTKREVSLTVRCAFENMGVTVEQSGDYPGWKPNSSSAILHIMKQHYQETFQAEPKVKACHAGLECGLLSEKLPGVDMISFGPNIRAAHSPDECVQISSVQKFWNFLLSTLTHIPKA